MLLGHDFYKALYTKLIINHTRSLIPIHASQDDSE